MSFGELALHILDADGWLQRKVTNPNLAPMQWRPESSRRVSRDDYSHLLECLTVAGTARGTLIAQFTEDKLSEYVPDARFPGNVTWWYVIVRGNLDHEIHHRGQIATYLRLLDLTNS